MTAAWDIRHGDCVEVMAGMDACSIDAVVCDPPYGIGFMGHEWDQPGVEHRAGPGKWDQPPAAGRTAPRSAGSMEAGKYDLRPAANRQFQAWCEAWAREAHRVLKPGGYLLASCGTRTSHRLAAGVEDAGFEIRDTIVWLYGSGFPKSLNLDGDWAGWGTALKPGHEPIVLARKPFAGTVAANVLEHGVGVLNIDGCRIGVEDQDYARNHSGDRGHAGTRAVEERGATDLRPGGGSASEVGRWPANVVLDQEAAGMLDEQTGELRSGANPTRRGADKFRGAYGAFVGQEECEPARGAESGGASRFFYCAKVSRAERDAGLDGLEKRPLNWSSGDENPGSFQSDGTEKAARNFHPTVKPIDLMRWLVRLVTPGGGLVLDPFAGSGTTGCAAVLEGFDFIGCEREADYVAIAEARIAWWASHPEGVEPERVMLRDRQRAEKAALGQLSMEPAA